jgi:cell division protein ZapA
MASVEVEIASRVYSVACRDGEEPHLRALAARIDAKAAEAARALGTLSEARLLLFAGLLLADELDERERSANGGVASAPAPPPPAPPPPAEPDPAVAEALERLAERMERLADRLEAEPSNP